MFFSIVLFFCHNFDILIKHVLTLIYLFISYADMSPTKGRLMRKSYYLLPKTMKKNPKIYWFENRKSFYSTTIIWCFHVVSSLSWSFKFHIIKFFYYQIFSSLNLFNTVDFWSMKMFRLESIIAVLRTEQ